MLDFQTTSKEKVVMSLWKSVGTYGTEQYHKVKENTGHSIVPKYSIDLNPYDRNQYFFSTDNKRLVLIY